MKMPGKFAKAASPSKKYKNLLENTLKQYTTKKNK